MKKDHYVEPEDYFPKEIREKAIIGEFASEKGGGGMSGQMDKSEKRFEYDIEEYLITKGGYEQFVGQDHNAPAGTSVWLHNRQHNIERCIYLDVLVEFIAKTQPKEWAKYTKYYGDKAPDKLYTRLEQTITNQGLIYVFRNGITVMGVKLNV